MAFKMKKPSMIQGTQAHKKALANIQTQGYANRPDGRNRSSAFQKHEPGHKDESAWTDWEETGQEKEGFKYGDYERDPLTGQWKKVGTKTTTTPGSEKPGISISISTPLPSGPFPIDPAGISCSIYPPGKRTPSSSSSVLTGGSTKPVNRI